VVGFIIVVVIVVVVIVTTTIVIMPLKRFLYTITYQLKTCLTCNNISTLQQANLISLRIISQLCYCVNVGNARP
jgi:hypothetical protein